MDEIAWESLKEVDACVLVRAFNASWEQGEVLEIDGKLIIVPLFKGMKGTLQTT